MADRQEKVRNPVTTLTESIGLLKRRSSSIGDRTRNSTSTNAAAATIDNANRARIGGEVNPAS